MPRIVYLGFPLPGVAGGQKMIFRHVEALRMLGFDAVFWSNESGAVPTWFEHEAPVEVGTPFRADDILVVPSDAPNAIATVATLRNRVFIFCQNHYTFASLGYKAVDAIPPGAFPTFISVGRVTAASIARAFPQASIELIPCFVDERLFRPRETKRQVIAAVPRKRTLEARVIQGFFRKFHARHAGIPWLVLDGVAEIAVADAFGTSALFLSLARFEAVGMTVLEAMASGCVVAGFTGLGGREFATAANGFWVEEDDCEAAADALARAADVVRTGGVALRHYREAAAETARAWSYAAFVQSLEEVWMRQAPAARCLPRTRVAPAGHGGVSAEPASAIARPQASRVPSA